VAPKKAKRAPAAAGAVHTKLASDVWVLIVQAFYSQHERFAETVRRFELSAPQWGLLRTLHFGEPRPMSQLAHALVCDVSNITGLVDRLEARGLVARKVDAHDRRVKVISITPAGRALTDRVLGELGVAPARLADLDARDLETLRGLLAKMLGPSLWTD